MLALTACGGGGGSIGEACETAGATTEECGDGAVCTPVGTQLSCAKICERQEDCGADEACSGLTGNIKSCQPE
jgi:hypothetical protein